jgi:hypothetical protein
MPEEEWRSSLVEDEGLGQGRGTPGTDQSSEPSPEEKAEVDAYAEVFMKSQQRMSEGRSDLALAELNQLQVPGTPLGKKFWPAVDMMKHIARANLHTLSGAKEEALAEWRAARKVAPPVPTFDEFRSQADGWILVQERGWENLTEDEYRSMSPPVQMFVNLQRALGTIEPAYEAASKALSSGDEGEFASQMAGISDGVARASAEFPQVRPILESTFDIVELAVMTLRQQRDFDEFEFRRVYGRVPEIVAKAADITSSEAATTPQAFPMTWIVHVAEAYVSLGRATERLSRVLESLFSSATTAAHLSEISAIEDTVRQTQRVLGDLVAPPEANTWREMLWDLSGKLLKLSERLSVLVRPSKRTVLNIAGLASAIAFVSLVGLLLLVGRLTDAQLNTGVVLSLSAFFGLVAGFGYGALRFKGFLGSILRGGDG